MWWILSCLVLLLTRFPMYFPAYDDLALHLILGDYTWNIWHTGIFLPMGSFTFTFPGWHLILSTLINTFGIRIANLLIYFGLMIWSYSLYLRFSRYFGDSSKVWLKLVWVLIFFYPALSATYFTFMTDLLAVMLGLESYYHGIDQKHGNINMAINCLLLTLAIKPATGIFILIPLLFLITKRYSQIKVSQIAPIAILLIWFHVKVWVLTGNPTPGLFNKIFQSNFYPLSNFRDSRWGPQALIQALVWPIIGPMTHRFDELNPVWYVRLIEIILPALAYILSLIKIRKYDFMNIAVVISFVLWISQGGYSRYGIALFGIAILSNLPYLIMSVKLPKYLPFLLPILAILALKTDFAWRPYPSFKNTASTDYFRQTYSEGLKLLGRDYPRKMAEVNKDFFANYTDIILNGRGLASFIGYLGDRNGITPKEWDKKANYSGKVLFISEYGIPDNCIQIHEPLSLPGIQNVEGGAKMAECGR